MFKRTAILPLLSLAIANSLHAQTTTSWNSTVDGTWSTAGNWTAGAPNTGPQIADYPGTSTLQKTLNLAGGTGRVSYGMVFDLAAGGIGYTFTGTAGTVAGFFVRSGATYNGIVNNDDNVQTFNVPVKLTSNSGIAGAGAAMTFNAAAGDMVFNGNNNAPAANWTINLNGATALTIDGGFNTTVGSSGPGQIVNTNVGTSTGIIKNGAGTLTLGGTAANTYTGTNQINAGLVLAAKANAFGAGNALILTGGAFGSGGLNQSFGILDLDGVATMDLGAGTSAETFSNSSTIDWTGGTLNIVNWTEGADSIRFGTDSNGLTPGQLAQIFFTDLPGSPNAQIDPNGFLTPVVVPEPSVAALSLVGGFGLAMLVFNRRKKG